MAPWYEGCSWRGVAAAACGLRGRRRPRLWKPAGQARCHQNGGRGYASQRSARYMRRLETTKSRSLISVLGCVDDDGHGYGSPCATHDVSERVTTRNRCRSSLRWRALRWRRLWKPSCRMRYKLSGRRGQVSRRGAQVEAWSEARCAATFCRC